MSLGGRAATRPAALTSKPLKHGREEGGTVGVKGKKKEGGKGRKG